MIHNKNVHQFISIQVNASDGLPQHICILCQGQIEMFYLLRKVSIDSDNYFKTLTNPERLLYSPLNIEEDVDPEQEYADLYGNTSEPCFESDIKTEPPEIMEDSPNQITTFQDASYPQSSTPRDARLSYNELTGWPQLKPIVYACEECDYSSAYKGNVFRHLRLRKHSGIKKVAPSELQMQANPSTIIRKKRILRPSLKELLANRDSPTVTIFSCGTCAYKSTFKGNMDRHMRGQQHNGLKTSIYRKKKPIDEDSLESSMNESQKSEELNISMFGNEEVKEEDTSTQTMHDSQHSDLETSMSNETPNASISNQDTKNSSMQSLVNKRLSKVKIFTCVSCSYKSAFKGNMDRHQRSKNHAGFRCTNYDKPNTIEQNPAMQLISVRECDSIAEAENPMIPLYDTIQQKQIKQEEENLMREMREEFTKIGVDSTNVP